MNSVYLTGNLGVDPEFRMAGQTRVATISVATNRKWTDGQGQKQEKTEWHRVEVWGGWSDALDGVKAGAAVFVYGTLEYSKWTDKDGQTRYTTTIRALEIRVLAKQAKDGGE